MFLPFLAVLVKEITGDANTKGSSKHTGIYCNYLFIDTFGRLFYVSESLYEMFWEVLWYMEVSLTQQSGDF